MPEVVVDSSIEVAAALMDVDGRSVLVVNPRSGTFDSLLAAACRALPTVHPDQVQLALRVAVGDQMPEAAPPVMYVSGPRLTPATANAVKREAHLIVVVGLAVSVIVGAAVAALILVVRSSDTVTAEELARTNASIVAGATTRPSPELVPPDEGYILRAESPIDPMLAIAPAFSCVGIRASVYKCTAPDRSVMIAETYVGGTSLATLFTSGTDAAIVYTFGSAEAAEAWRDSTIGLLLPHSAVTDMTVILGTDKALVERLADVVRTRNNGDVWPPAEPGDGPRAMVETTKAPSPPEGSERAEAAAPWWAGAKAAWRP